MFQIRKPQKVFETNQKPPDQNQIFITGNNSYKIARNRDQKQKMFLFSKMIVFNMIWLITFNMYNDFFPIPHVRAQDAYLNGIGYREQALQVPKGALFMSEDPVGVPYASFAGDTNIFIKGTSFSMRTQSNQIKLTCVEFPNIIIFPLILAEDDIFNSHPALGELVYRIPPLNKLLGMKQQQQVFLFTTLNFIVSIKNIDSDMEGEMACLIKSNCRISYQRYYTPIIHYISPQTVYYQSQTQITFDPQLVPSKIVNLTTDDKPFVNAKISGQLIDFEFQVDQNTIYNTNSYSKAKGTVGTISPGINQNITMLWEVGGSMVEDTESITCDVLGQNCYQAKGVPVIFNMSANQGYTTGGQNLTVNGFGFNNPNLKATLDGQNCLITSYSNTSFSCTVSPAAQISVINVTQPGGYGAKRRIYNASSTYLQLSQMRNMNFQEEHLHLNFELPTNIGTYYGSRLTSFFIPPLTTRYRFYMACDDICDLSIGLDPANPANITTLLQNLYSAGRVRNFWSTAGNQTRITDWITLQANQNYFLQSYFSQFSGGDYLSVGVEIEQSSVVNHPNSMIEIQNIQVVPPVLKDTWQLTVAVDSTTKGDFNLVLRHPTAGFKTSDTIPVPATANQLQNALSTYYWKNWGSGINVNLTMYDSLGAVTTNKTNATLYQYFIVCNKLIANQSSTSIQMGLKQTTAQITIIPPSQVQISSAPLSGKFQIQCNDSQGNTYLTNQLSYNAWEETIRDYITYACPMFAHKVQVERRTDGDFNYNENGLALQLIFSGYTEQPGQFKIVSGNVTQLAPDSLVYTQYKVQNKNNNLFYPTIPFEFLKTVETLPQLLVQVGDLPAVCHNLTCNYTYISPPGEITSFSFDENSLILTIQGTNLPNSIDKIQSIDFAKSQCLTTQASDQAIQCTLVQNPTCGSYTPNLISIFGKIPIASVVSTQVILCQQVSQVLPSSSLNLLGGDNITIVSTNLPIQLELSKVSINFNDSQSTSCIPQVSSTTQIVCLTNPFNLADASQTIVAQIYINDLLITNTQSLVLRSKTQTVQAITPASVSPVLKTQILVQLPVDFPYSLTKEDFSVNATNQTNSKYVRYLKVIKADDTSKTITVMFGGAWSGKYTLAIRHKHEGLLDTAQIILDVSAGISSVSPLQGSIMGGTILTIQGYNFGTQKTDNPVQLQMAEGGVGNLDCFVITTNSQTITCQLDNTTTTSGKIVNVLVFLKVSEEAKGTGSFKFTFTDQIPTITSIQQIWDQTINQYQIQVGGTGFDPVDVGGTVFKANGTAQPILSLNSTHAIFTVTNLTSSLLINNDFYFPSGYPLGKADFVDSYNVRLIPQLVSISPNQGSIGGTIIVANIQGVGSVDASNLQLVLANGTQICSQVIIPSYGQVICRVVPKFIPASSSISVQLNSQNYACANSDPTKCMFQQLSTDQSMPVLTSSSIVSNTIVFTGTGFFTSAYNPKAVFNGIQADSVVVSSTTNAVATWNLGVPLISISTAPELRFESQNDLGTAIITNPNGKNLTNAFTLQSTNAASLSCSFAGGCKLQIQADGLSSMLNGNPQENSVQVCGVNCSFLLTDSSVQTAVCKLPAISTLYSNQNFKISAQNPDLKPTQIWGTMKNITAIFDGNNLNSMAQVGQTSKQCMIGVSFRESQVAYLTQVRLFQNDKVEISKFINGQLKFQGSSDNATWIDLWQGDDNYREGWNYITFDNSANSNNVYRFYRILGGDWGSCGQSEIKFTGVETVNDQNSIYQCPIKVSLGSISTTLPDKVNFDGSITPLLTSISPRYGTVTGGDMVTFTGSGFSQSIADYTISLDGRICNPVSATETSVTCVTDKRIGLIPTATSIFIFGKGFVSTQGLVFTYVNLWSNDATWGGEFAPMDGETIHIPQGLNLVVDIDQTPVLNTILVEGSLIFIPDPVNSNHQRSLDAKNILVFGGKLEAGTEQYPYTSELTITMHGNQADPFIPIYGNKVIGVRYGTIDMHGVKKSPTWTYLDKTALANSNQVTLSTPVNWQVGDLIAIPSTSYDGREGEQRTIISIDRITNPNKPILTFDSPLEFQHFAKIEQYGSEFIDMRAEIGCLSRNVKYRGDPETSSQNQYGAIFFFHSPGDDSLTARLDNIEMSDVGQANKVGHYAVHFHMIGAVHNSYVKQIAIHQSFNRAVTMHGTHYLRMTENVVYETAGHNFFIEDAAETKNYMYRNLVMKVIRSCSLLNTDFTPAGFWITHPDNNFIGNHVAGSDRYGYWYDLKPNSIGPNANPNICPINSVVGEFRDNSAHSCERYGLRIFHGMIPRKYPCLPIIYDANNKSDPYWQNPPITANFYNLTSWKNGRNGAIAERMGDVRFHQFKVSDNILAGIEFSLTNEYGDNMAQVNDSLINGVSNNTDWMIQTATPRGIITARTESFTVQNTRFFNFNWLTAAAFGTCSHCFHPASTDSGGRTTTLKNLTFDSTVTRYISYQFPFLEILHDVDGSFTGLGPNSWATPYYPHHNVKECQYKEKYNGVICDGTAQVRRIAFSNSLPEGVMSGMSMKVLVYDDDLLNSINKTQYLLNRTNHTSIQFRPELEPMKGWPVPLVTGHKYKISWGDSGIDWLQMQFDMSIRWQQDDKPIYFVNNFTDTRALLNLTILDPKAKGKMYQPFENNSIPASSSDYQMGQFVLYNDMSIRETHFIVSPKNISQNPKVETKVLMKMEQCAGSCNPQVVEVPKENITRYWANASDWPSGQVPAAGAYVEVLSGWNMIYNLRDSPIYGTIVVNGNLTFDNTTDLHLHCKILFIRAGQLHIGSSDYPYTKRAIITLYGARSESTIAFDNVIEAGNKMLVNINKVFIYGLRRKQTLMRLRREASKRDTQILLDPGLDLVPGDRLALLPTSYKYRTRDDVFVQSYDSSSGLVTLNSSLNFYHYGAAESTASKYAGIDIRGEVLLLTRNILIHGQDIDGWGCQIVTSDTVEFYNNTLVPRNGQMILDSVEIWNCSQMDSFKAAIRFDNAATLDSKVTNSAIHNGNAWGVRVVSSKNILFENNVIFAFAPIGFGVLSSSNITINQNVVGYVHPRPSFSAVHLVDKEGAFSICAYDKGDKCSQISVTNNIGAASNYAGFVVGVGYKCGEEANQQVFRNNIAHSHSGKDGDGAIVGKDANIPDHENCVPISHFAGYKNSESGAFIFAKTLKLQISNIISIDNLKGLSGLIFGDVDDYIDRQIQGFDNQIFGESESPDCPNQGEGDFCFNFTKMGLQSFYGDDDNKPLHILIPSALPAAKIMREPLWNVKIQFYRTKFSGFKSKTRDGLTQSVLGLNPDASDYVPMHQFFETTFTDVDEDAMAFIMQPPQEWANPDDCQQWPCSAPLNALFTFKNTTFAGSSSSTLLDKDFQIIADNPGFSQYVPNCQKVQNMSHWICQQKQGLSILLFDSLDTDRRDRSAQPIYYRKQGTMIKNNLNAIMDHVWDGFYTGQKRLQRFPGIVWTPLKSVYDVVYTGSPPKNQRFKLISQDPLASMTIRIAYPDASSYQIKIDNKRIPMNEWDDSLRMYRKIEGTFCGENRFIGVKNILEFYLTVDCDVFIAPRDAIQTNVRMEWTMASFFASGGTTNFIDRLAGALGIHSSDIKVVSVYEGSLVVNYAVTSDTDDKDYLYQIGNKSVDLYATGQINLGAPVLDVTITQIRNTNESTQTSQSQRVVANGIVVSEGYDRIILTNVTANKYTPSEFVPNIGISQNNQTIYKDILVQQEQIQTVQNQESKLENDPLSIFQQKTESWVYILIGVFVAILIISILIFIRYYITQKNQDLIQAQKLAERRQNEEKQNQTAEDDCKASNDEVDRAANTNQKLRDRPEREILENQYDPAVDFPVFSVGNKRHGGLQSLKDKINLGDDINSSSSVENNTQGVQMTNFENGGAQDALVMDKLDNRTDVRQILAQDLIRKKNKYQLEEDKEIKEEEE